MSIVYHVKIGTDKLVTNRDYRDSLENEDQMEMVTDMIGNCD